MNQAELHEAELRWMMSGPDNHDLPTLESLLARPSWHRQAACRGMGADTFFPERGVSIRAATTVCDGCSVRDECLNAAQAIGEDCHGVWAALSREGRRVLRRSVA